MQFPADLVTFTEEILNEKLYFLCGEQYLEPQIQVFYAFYVSDRLHILTILPEIIIAFLMISGGIGIYLLNTFVPNAPFFYPLKICFQGVE